MLGNYILTFFRNLIEMSRTSLTNKKKYEKYITPTSPQPNLPSSRKRRRGGIYEIAPYLIHTGNEISNVRCT